MVPLHQTLVQRGSLVLFQVTFQNIIPLIPYSGTRSPGSAGDISPGNPVLLGNVLFSLPVPEQITHSLPGTVWPGEINATTIYGGSSTCGLTLAAGELHVPPKYLLPQVYGAQELNLLSCYVEWEWRSQNMFY